MDRYFQATEDAFAVLASPLRLQILEACSDPEQVLYSFTELYERVDISSTSQFSYHLNELTDRYVHEMDGGYAISDVGRRIVQSVKSGEYTLQPEFESVDISTYCVYCEATAAEAKYDGLLATIDCLSCENTLLRYDLRPGHVLERNSLQALKTADRQMRAEVSSALDGVCQRCGGSMILEFLTGPEAEPATVLVLCNCQQCETRLSVPIEIALLHHPEVGSRYWDDGIHVSTTPTWEMLPTLSEWSIELAESGVATVVIPGNEQLRFRVRWDDQVQANLMDTVEREQRSPQ